MELPYDIHTVILSKIYTIEDHIYYCEALNIDCHFNLCQEIIDMRLGIGNRLKSYITNIRKFCIKCIEFERAIRLDIYPESFNTVYDNDDEDENNIIIEILPSDLLWLLDSKVIYLFDLNYIYLIEEYLHRAKKICMEKSFVNCPEKILSSVKNLNSYSTNYTDMKDIDSINFCKLISFYTGGINKSRRLLIIHRSDYNFPMFMNNDTVEHLIVSIYVVDNQNIILKNLPNLKILTLKLRKHKKFIMDSTSDMSYEFKIISEGLPKLKVILYRGNNFYIDTNVQIFKIYDYLT